MEEGVVVITVQDQSYVAVRRIFAEIGVGGTGRGKYTTEVALQNGSLLLVEVELIRPVAQP